MAVSITTTFTNKKQLNTGRTHFKKGHIPWNKGLTQDDPRVKSYVEKQIKRIVKTCKVCGEVIEVKVCLQYRKKYCSWKCRNKGFKGRKSWNKGIKIDREKYPTFGHFQKHTEESKKKNSKTHKKNPIRYWLGKKMSEDTKRKIRIKNSGENHPRWKGGISREPYGFDFNEELKELIRKRDNYKCQLCGCPQEECETKLPIHHIDYDKENSNPNNLISLCISCHSKTNEKRDYWVGYLKERC